MSLSLSQWYILWVNFFTSFIITVFKLDGKEFVSCPSQMFC